MEIGPNFLSVVTAASGTEWVAFPSYRCSTMSVLNNSGASVSLRRSGEVDGARVLLLKDGQAWMVRSLTNSNQLEVRRADGGNTQVTVHGEAE